MTRVQAALRSASNMAIHQPITFYVDGRPYQGLAGDTLASALLANGIKLVGRSFKLHRPRGLLAAGVEEPNGLMQLEPGTAFDEPNARATQIPLYPGLNVSRQNAWPSVDFDLLGLLSFLHPLLPASFYYKSLFWPNWHTYEGIVRRLAGLGKAPKQPDAQRYHQHNLHCEV
ncbi:2Fe-2S iron-sulfur cluster-binding protein, partial [Porticoccaceae bacterium]|nr:2Fe-2S iron-sulfur cluster-binding protein [Porticoccaceae bacterium]